MPDQSAPVLDTIAGMTAASLLNCDPGAREHMIARFYMKRGSYISAVQRLNYLVDTYGNYNDRAGAFYDLGTSLTRLGRQGEARLYFERVLTEFPDSDYAERARQRLGEIKA